MGGSAQILATSACWRTLTSRTSAPCTGSSAVTTVARHTVITTYRRHGFTSLRYDGAPSLDVIHQTSKRGKSLPAWHPAEEPAPPRPLTYQEVWASLTLSQLLRMAMVEAVETRSPP